MKEKLAINGGEKVFTETPQVPVWPVVSEETAEKLKKSLLEWEMVVQRPGRTKIC